MSKYKWWLHKKEINRITNNIDTIANQVLEEYPCMSSLTIDGLQTACVMAMERHQTAMLVQMFEAEAGSRLEIVQRGRTIMGHILGETGVYQVQAEITEGHARMILARTDNAGRSMIMVDTNGGIINESRAA